MNSKNIINCRLIEHHDMSIFSFHQNKTNCKLFSANLCTFGRMHIRSVHLKYIKKCSEVEHILRKKD